MRYGTTRRQKLPTTLSVRAAGLLILVWSPIAGAGRQGAFGVR
jgi:hypothetical protein